MTEIFTNIIGYIAVVVGTSIMLPQIIKSWKTKRVSDLSFGMVFLYFFNCILWVIYGLLISALPIIIANGTGFIISIVQLALKLKYNDQSKNFS